MLHTPTHFGIHCESACKRENMQKKKTDRPVRHDALAIERDSVARVPVDIACRECMQSHILEQGYGHGHKTLETCTRHTYLNTRTLCLTHTCCNRIGVNENNFDDKMRIRRGDREGRGVSKQIRYTWNIHSYTWLHRDIREVLRLMILVQS